MRRAIRLIGWLVGGLVLAGGILGLAGGRDPRPAVLVEGKALPARGEVRYGQVYVDALILGRALDLRTVYFPDRPLRGVWLQDPRRGIFVHLHTGERDCHVGSETVRTGFPTLYLRRGTNTPMAPVRLVAEVFGAEVREWRWAGLVREVVVTPRPRS